ncbi:MAG: helix-turn-helix transcriptional regulator [Polyangiaceae bacterium]|nr:helix-turn-helix transcriptional regulator [Polyangiaceae bacterium]
MFATKGFEAATMEEVADEAAMAKGTLYLYFPSKEALFLGLTLRHQEELVRRYGAAAADAESGIELLERLFAAYYELARERLELYRLSLGLWLTSRTGCAAEAGCRQEQTGQRRRLFNMILRAVERGVADGSVRRDIAPRTLALELWAGALGGLLVELERASVAREVALDPAVIPSFPHLLVEAVRAPRAARPSGRRRAAAPRLARRGAA